MSRGQFSLRGGRLEKAAYVFRTAKALCAGLRGKTGEMFGLIGFDAQVLCVRRSVLHFLVVVGRIADVLRPERNHVAEVEVVEGKGLVRQTAHEIPVAIELLDLDPHFFVRPLIDSGIGILKAKFDEIANCDF